MAEKLYYQDAYLKEFQAEITEVKKRDGKLLVALNKTAFYPEGGGQRPDGGTITICKKEKMSSSGASLTSESPLSNDADRKQELFFTVIDVQEEEGEIWHYLDANKETEKCLETDVLLQPGQMVVGRIDWNRRFDHMQQHSGEHIISGMICSAFDCSNVGFHMGEEEVTIDYSARISMEEVLEIEAAANRYLWEDHPFVQMWPTAEELKTIEYRSKKELEGDVRITSFPGADCCACCGTHVKSSAEVGLIKITSAHNFHEGTRFTLYCGKRALDYLNRSFQANKKTAVLLSTKEERTFEVVQKQMEEFASLKGRFSQMQEDYFKMWAENFEGKEQALIISDRLDPEEGRKLCDLLADKVSGTAAVFTKVKENGDETSVFRYAIMNRGEDISGMIREMNQQLSGKGGGRNGFAQGNVSVSESAIRRFFS